MSFIIPRPLLHRGLLNRGSTILAKDFDFPVFQSLLMQSDCQLARSLHVHVAYLI